MQLSQRVLRESESATMAVGRRAEELRASGVELFDLGAGEPSLASPPAAIRGAARALEAGYTRYTAVEGLADLRLALAQRHQELGGVWSGEGDVLVTVGAKAALLEAILALVDPGCEVVIPVPCWMTLQSQVRLAGGEVKSVAVSPANGFALEAGPLVEALTPRTRAVIVNSPCNPTGAVMAADEMRRLVAACAERGVVVVSDETYSAFVYDLDGDDAASSMSSVAAEFPESVVLVSALSKAFAMTGWRVGYALGPRRLIGAMRSIQSHATSNATTFAMMGALAALKDEASFEQKHREFCRANRERVSRILSGRANIAYRPPQGAFYAFPQIDLEQCDYGASTAEVAVRLLEEERVVLVPGEAFGAPGYLRISFAGDPETLEEGLRRLVEALS